MRIRLALLTSRCTIPRECASSSASVTCSPISIDLADRQRALRDARRQQLAFDVLHDDEVGAAGLADVVGDGDVGRTQERRRPRLVEQAGAALRIGFELGRQELQRDRTTEANILGSIHLAHAAGAKAFADAIVLNRSTVSWSQLRARVNCRDPLLRRGGQPRRSHGPVLSFAPCRKSIFLPDGRSMDARPIAVFLGTVCSRCLQLRACGAPAAQTAGSAAAARSRGRCPRLRSWHLMQDGVVFLNFNHQGRPRGGDEFAVQNWWMGMAERPAGRGSLDFTADVQPRARDAWQRRLPRDLPVGETLNGRFR